MGNNHVVSYQSPRPEVKIWKPDRTGSPICFDTAQKRILQSYTFGTSINEQKGKFTLTFYPDIDGLPPGEEAIIDQIQILDVVEIYESKNHLLQRQIKINGVASTAYDKIVPTFVGVIREKKYSSSMANGGANRKITVSGHSIAGFVNEFKMNLDMQATVITEELANNEEVQKQFTIKFIQTNMEPLDVAYVIKEVWKSFVDLSKRYQASSTLKIEEYLQKWIGGADEIFDIDTTTKFHYPIGSIFKGQSTQTFNDIITHLIPQPVYEIFPYMDLKKGKMRLKIREVPFDMDIWSNSNKIKKTQIDPKSIKSFDVKQNDNEVYTVFFSYLNGYPIQQDKAIILAAQKVSDMPGVEINAEKFQVYGYRPLFVNFNGYGRANGEEDTDTSSRLQKLNQRLKDWFGNKEKMYSGTISMETNLAEDMPQPGEIVAFLDGEFYVVDSEHNWNYGVAPETRITIDRGGDYKFNNFSELKDISKRYQEFVKTIKRLGEF